MAQLKGNSTVAGLLTVDTDLVVSGGDITLGGTGRIQGIDTVTAGTDAVNKNYVDNAISAASDADTLDGLNSTQFLRSDVDDQFTADNLDIAQKIRHIGDTDTWMEFNASNQWRVVAGGLVKLSVTNTETTIESGLTVTNGQIQLNGTGRIQGIDTVTASTDAANKQYVDDQISNNVDFYSYTFTDIPASANAHTINHNKGAYPKMFMAVLRNKVSDGGYAVGDEIPVWPQWFNDGEERGAQITFNTNQFSFIPRGLKSFNKTSGDTFTPNSTSWDVVVKAIF